MAQQKIKAVDESSSVDKARDKQGLQKLLPSLGFFGAPDLKRSLRVQRRVQLSDTVSGEVGVEYNLGKATLAPIGSFSYNLGSLSSLELTEQRCYLKRNWPFAHKQFSATLTGECGVTFQGAKKGRREISVGVSDIKPFGLYVAGIALVVLANIPITLTDKELNLHLPGTKARAFAGYTVKRTGFAKATAELKQASLIIEA